MGKIKIILEIDFESWFSDGREPKTKEDWVGFFQQYYLPDSSVIGVDDGELQDMIAIDSTTIEVVYLTENDGKPPIICEVEKLTNEILKCFPKFFADFKNWDYANGVDAGKDFKRIFNKAKKINKAISKKLKL